MSDATSNDEVTTDNGIQLTATEAKKVPAKAPVKVAKATPVGDEFEQMAEAMLRLHPSAQLVTPTVLRLDH